MKREPLCVLVNDLHVDKNNIPEFKKNWQELLALCKDRGIYEIVIGGDLWTSRAGQTLETLLAVQDFVLTATEDYDLELTIAEGNHDKVDQRQLEGYSHVFKHCRNVSVVDSDKLLGWEECDQNLLVMSYFPETDSFVEHFEVWANAPLSFKSHTTLYLHEGIQGGLPGGFIAPTDLPVDIFAGFKQVLVGHYHNRIHIPDTNIWYIGSSRQANFGEDEEKGYTIFYDDGSTEFVKNKVNTRYETQELDYKDLSNRFSDYSEQYKIRLKIHCTETEVKLIDKQALVEEGFNKVEVVVEKKKLTAETSSIDEKYDRDTLTKEYVNFCSKEKIDSTLGTQYLKKIS